ncbi:hypothetical protein Q3V37_17445 [Micromonospora profundi]|uniref:Chromosome segregation ATPase n=1 Tax=Micromonospora profundi TaxID=1420889 RepID=A0AAJ6HMA7_9ACTN|nr:hypothetical protein [Micromonospora profundi]WLS43206.1 hypothetical protein Q3V37_17445 [Micromonospora profundi]
MYELLRIRLHSVGPAGARYQDVVLDFSGVGRAVTYQQESLLDRPEILRRPSPASVLFLENGGGKSVLMKLIFSVVLPGRRRVVGTTNTRVLEKFVQADDVAHVALEWMHAETGRLLVTGKISEWRNQVVSADPENLLDLWYYFRPTESMDLDRLPLTQDGRLISASGFQHRLTELTAIDPRLAFYNTRRHGEWTERLDQLGLDSELFRYQREMNAGEGEAVDAFAFTSDEAFVEFLLKAVHDEAAPRELADMLTKYAEVIAMRDDLLLEQDFIGGALERLEPLASAATAEEKAKSTARLLAENHRGLETRIITRAARERELVKVRKALADDRVAAEADAKADASQRASAVAELQWFDASYKLGEAEREETTSKAAHGQAKAELRAWEDTQKIIDLRAASYLVKQLRERVEATESQALPALEQKNLAASALVRALRQLVEESQQKAAAAAERAVSCDATAENAQAAAAAAGASASARRAEADLWKQEIENVWKALDAARHDGLLLGESTARMAAAAAIEAGEALKAELEDRERELDRLDERVQSAYQKVMAEGAALGVAESAAERAAESYRGAVDRTGQLAADPRLVDLNDGTDVLLDQDHQVLLERLRAANEEAGQEHVVLRVEASDDARERVDLENGRLLPPPPEIVSACVALNEAGIHAWTGWEYLAEIADVDARRDILRRVPQLATGVVLNDARDLPTAQEVLTARRILPTMHIGVGSAEALLAADRDGIAGAAFVVPLDPALYDPAAAEQALAAILDRDGVRERRMMALVTEIDRDADLAAQIRLWRAEFPEGAVAELAANAQSATAIVSEAQQNALLSEREYQTAVDERDGVRDDRSRLKQAIPESDERCHRLARLAEDESRATSLSEQVSTTREDAERQEAEKNRKDQEARAQRAEAELQRRQEEALRQSISRHREEISRVAGGDDMADAPIPAEPVEELRQRFQTARELYAEVELGADLRTALTAAETQEAAKRSVEAGIEAQSRAWATELLNTPAGADEAGREGAVRAAQRSVTRTQERVVEAAKETARCTTKLNGLMRQHDLPSDFLRPDNHEHVTELLAAARIRSRSAERHLVKATEARVLAENEHGRVARQAERFQDIIDAMDSREEGDAVAEPYERDHDAARAALGTSRRALRTAQRTATEAATDTTRAAESLSNFAAESRFDLLGSNFRKQINSIPVSGLAVYAQEWSVALRPRLASLTGDLADIERHRDGIVLRLHGMVDNALQTLRTAQKVSRLPSGLGDWTGQEFLRIRYKPLETGPLRHRLGEIIDEAAKGKTADGREVKRDGMSLLLRGVRAAAPHGFRVDMLKPDSVLREERERVSEIKDVFSGGQQLTAAILLYCTMAALRANHRGRLRDRHSGVLFLDNPIGRASASYLIGLQRSVAEALGVQLIYTTGLFDADALREFPLVVRLRNDADLRAGRKYLSVDKSVRERWSPLRPAGDGGDLSSVRMFVREEASIDTNPGGGTFAEPAGGNRD